MPCFQVAACLLQGALAALDLSEQSELLDCLVPEWLRPLRTTYEGDFGTPLGDFYFFPNELLVRTPPCTACSYYCLTRACCDISRFGSRAQPSNHC